MKKDWRTCHPPRRQAGDRQNRHRHGIGTAARRGHAIHDHERLRGI